jgi:hypothetical protein
MTATQAQVLQLAFGQVALTLAPLLDVFHLQQRHPRFL